MNNWRTRFGHLGTELQQGRPLDENVQSLLNVEDESFGKFPNGFGDNRPSDEEAEIYQDVGETNGPGLTDIPEVQRDHTGHDPSLSSRLDAVALAPDDSNIPPRIEDPLPNPGFPGPPNVAQPNNGPASHQLGAGVPACLLSSFGTDEQPAMHQAAVPLGVDDLWELIGPSPQLDVNPALAESRTMHDDTRNSGGLTGQLYF